MKTDRRSYLKMLLAGGAVTAGALLSLNAAANALNGVGKVSQDQDSHDLGDNNSGHVGTSATYPEPNDPNMNLGMVIDLNRCDGCQDDMVYSPATDSYEPRCTAACRQMHNVPPDQEWIKVFHKKDNPKDEGYYFPRPCMQCQDPPCVNVCPVGAAFHRDEGDGLVLIKYDRCIGCRACMGGCPYEVRYFNWSEYDEPNKEILQHHSYMYATKRTKGTVEKCDFCAHLGYQGKVSACTSSCPKGAIYYGNLKEDAMTNGLGETVRVTEVISKYGGFRFKEEYNTQPRVYYIPKRGAEH